MHDIISADEAYRLGLINQITRADELNKVFGELVEKLLQLDPDSFAMAKAVLSGSGNTVSTTEQEIWFDILSTLYVKVKE